MGKKWVKLFVSIIGISIILCGCDKKNNSIEVNETSLVRQVKTQNFIFYSVDKDKKCIDDLSKELEDNQKVITNKLKVKIDDKIKVQIYPDIKSLHVAMNIADANDSIVGTGWGNELKIVSPLNPGTIHNYDSVKKALVHEFTHVVISKINNNINEIPAWLNEGIATYEAKQMNEKAREFIKQRVSENKIPSFENITKGFNTPDGSHIFSYTIAEFLVNNYGYDRMIDILKTPKDLEKILGVSIYEFEKQWFSYLKENY
jgi:hypothetical protein